jgi:hypothetical protein
MSYLHRRHPSTPATTRRDQSANGNMRCHTGEPVVH